MDEDQGILDHPSYNQVKLDVDRCAGRLDGEIYYHRDGPCSSNSPDSDLNNQHTELKDKLTRLIVKLLKKKPDLHYYQGFHDVCLTYIILIDDEIEAEKKLDKMIDSHFNIYMQPSMLETQEHLALIPTIIGLHDWKLQKFLEKSEVGTIFALSWVITWFSHVISKQNDIEKIFNFLEKHDPHMVLYLSAELVLSKKDEIMQIEQEMSALHQYLSQLPKKENIPYDKLFRKAETAFDKWPPNMLKKILETSRRMNLYQSHNFNLVRVLAGSLFEPYWSRLVVQHPRLTNVMRIVASPFSPFMNTFSATNPRTAIVVMVLASALLFQYDRWTRN